MAILILKSTNGKDRDGSNKLFQIVELKILKISGDKRTFQNFKGVN